MSKRLTQNTNFMRSVLTIVFAIVCLQFASAQSISFEVMSNIEVKDMSGNTLTLGNLGGLKPATVLQPGYQQ